jgi:5'-3' exonuclease
MNILLNLMTKNTTPTPTFIFIDGSYYNFYRYHSLLTWWKNAYPEDTECLKDPYQNTIFLEKFKKTFIKNIKDIQKNLKIDKQIDPIIVIGKDCKRQDIWRTKLFPEYKANRANSAEDGFMGGPFFKMVYEEKLFIEAGASCILKHPHLEADDCIAISVKHILSKYPASTIYIITSDKDYLQLAEPRIHLYNLAFKKLTDQKSSTKDPKCDLFCKIITGDPSDNISSVFPKCGPKTAMKYYENRELFQIKLNSSPDFQQKYQLNSTLVDFNNIPQELVDEFMSNCSSE